MASRVRLSLIFLVCLTASCVGDVPARAGIIEMVTVGDPGNSPDPATGSVFGAVSYSYQIAKYDVTIGQYTAFLNAADPNGTNPNNIYNAAMGTNLNVSGISYTAGASAGSKYAVIINGGDSSNRPITFVSWFDAARFANWMANGQGAGSTETGAYTLNNATSGNAVAVNAGAAFYIPTENEWYKSAYYSPFLNSGSGGYYKYATQSDSDPGNIIGSGANQANYYAGNGYSVTQSSGFDANQNYLTEVGAFSGSGSFYGTFDQSGNVYQWNDLNGAAGSTRGLRGGGWNYGNTPFYLSSSLSFSEGPSIELLNLGFRLASPVASGVPEIDPSSLGGVLAIVLGSLGMLERRRLNVKPAV